MSDFLNEAQLIAALGGPQPSGIAMENLIHTVFSGVAESNQFFSQPTPTAKVGDATLTIAELLTDIITVTSAAAVALTLPTGTLTDAGILSGALPNDKSFEWGVINLGSSSGVVTVVAGATHTLVGLATIAINTQARFRTRKTAKNTFVTYRVA
jgi:hypothetical protein